MSCGPNGDGYVKAQASALPAASPTVTDLPSSETTGGKKLVTDTGFVTAPLHSSSAPKGGIVARAAAGVYRVAFFMVIFGHTVEVATIDFEGYLPALIRAAELARDLQASAFEITGPAGQTHRYLMRADGTAIRAIALSAA